MNWEIILLLSLSVLALCLSLSLSVSLTLSVLRLSGLVTAGLDVSPNPARVAGVTPRGSGAPIHSPAAAAAAAVAVAIAVRRSLLVHATGHEQWAVCLRLLFPGLVALMATEAALHGAGAGRGGAAVVGGRPRGAGLSLPRIGNAQQRPALKPLT